MEEARAAHAEAGSVDLGLKKDGTSLFLCVLLMELCLVSISTHGTVTGDLMGAHR